MTDKVQRIREEVVRLKKRAEHNFDISLTENERQYWLGEFNVLTLIGKYIDSLQEEPETKFKIGDRIRLKGTTVKGDTIIRIYTSEVGNTYFEFKNSDVASADLDWELLEEPKKCMFTKEEFTEEDRKILCEDCEEECEYAKKEEPVSEDLLKASMEFAKGFGEWHYAMPCFQAGAKWQKEQDKK